MWIFISLIPGLLPLSSPGKPIVPVIRKLIRGDTTNIAVSITYAESTAKMEIPPAPYPVRKDSKFGETFKDPSVYNRDAFYPARPYVVYYLGKRRDIPYYILEVHPYQYNPMKKIIKYAKSIDIKGERNTQPLKEKNIDTLLIVTPQKFLSALDYFIFYKSLLGFAVDTIVIQPLWDQDTIREEISKIQPDYLLLVGDTGDVPGFVKELYIPEWGNDERTTDLYYACTDSDYIPDMYYGRMSIEDTTELCNLIKKIINYDSSQTSWNGRAFFMASNDAAWHSLVEETHIYSMQKVRSNGMTVDSNFAYYTSNPGTPLKEAFSSGRSLAAYSGHGNKYSWQGPSFNLGDIQDLPPNLRTPIVFSFACLTGAYDENDCFMEEWNTAENKGSIISYGSSTFSYWEEDDIFERCIFDVLFEGLSIGAVIDTAKLLFARDYTGDSVFIESYYQQYNLLGDPTLRVRSGNEEKISIDIPIICALNDTITAVLSDEGRIGLKQENIKLILDTDPSGRVEIPLSAFQEGRVSVTAVAPGKLLTEKTIHLTNAPLDEIFTVKQKLTTGVFGIHFFAIEGKVKANLYDALGRHVDERSWTYGRDGEQDVGWDISDFAPGTYFLIVNQQDLWKFTEKIVKL